MIDPKPIDLFRRVAYVDTNVCVKTQDYLCFKTEYGYIKTYTEHYVFVCYSTGETAAATRREDLYWVREDGGLEGFPK